MIWFILYFQSQKYLYRVNCLILTLTLLTQKDEISSKLNTVISIKLILNIKSIFWFSKNKIGNLAF